MEQNDKEKRPKFNLDEPPTPSSLLGPAARSPVRRKTPALNRRNSIILLVVLFAVMALLVFSQMGKEPEAPDAPVAPEVPGATDQTVPGGAPSGSEMTGEMPQPYEMPNAPGSIEAGAPLDQPDADSPRDLAEGGGVQQPVTEGQTMPGGAEAPSAGTGEAPAQEMPAMAPEEPQQPAQVAEAPAPAQPAPAAPAKEPEPQAPAGPKNKLTNVKIVPGSGMVTMRISTDLPLEHYKYFTLEGPRVVVDLLGPFKAHATTMAVPANQLVKGLRIGNHPDKLRLVADITGGKNVKVDVARVSEKELTVTVSGNR